MKTIIFHNVYVKARASVVGPKEKEGPLHTLFDKTYDDLYGGMKTFEKCEQQFILDACQITLSKAKLEKKDIDLIIGGDLMNQLTSSHYAMKAYPSSFIGMYGACATSSLIVGNAAIWLQNKEISKVLCFTSSHNGTAERQFRYPNEYGIQKKTSTTYTVSGAGAMLLSKEKTNIKVTAFTVGKIVDWNHKDANDMGKAMAPAAFETILTHLQNRNLKITDYDAIVTGDLSKIGFSMLVELLRNEKLEIDNRVSDCGLLIYDLLEQDVFAGGSGCACSMCVSVASLLKKVEEEAINVY